jgi:outer membrane protein assembly factor BamB
MLRITFSAILLLCMPQGVRGDWTEHRGNLQRTGHVEQNLNSSHWKPLWTYSALSTPTPAWPPPAKASLWQKLDTIAARVTDDQADVPLIATDAHGRSHVLVTSSANDRLISLDPITGQLRWQYVALAPVRYAPSVENGIAYLGADDGMVRAIDIGSGKAIWETRIGPEMPWVVGNERLISSHPIRTSVIVDNGSVFATAGLFPSQGVYSVCLAAETGRVLWRRKINQSPQGYLLADAEKVFVPTGRSQPFALKSTDGRLLFKLESPGGSFCILTPDALLSGPGNNSAIEGKPNQPGSKMLSFPGKQFAAGGGLIWSSNGATLVGRSTQAEIDEKPSTVWSVACQLDQALIVSGVHDDQTLFVAGGPTIEYYNAQSGELRGTLSLSNRDSEIKYLAVSPVAHDNTEVLVATTAAGEVFAWRGTDKPMAGQWAKANNIKKVGPNTTGNKQLINGIQSRLKSPYGWALVLAESEGHLVQELITHTKLRIVSVLDNPEAVAELRDDLMRKGVYGHRVTVWQHEDDTALPFSKGIFNAVVEAAPTQYASQQLIDYASPATGFVWRAGAEFPINAPPLAGAGVWRHQYANPANSSSTQDKLVGNAAGFRLLWFGGVGPSRMPDRHLRGPAPLTAGGATVLQGDGVLIGIDPANGTERWQLELPESAMRYVTPFDAGYVCMTQDGDSLIVAANHELWHVDPYLGTVLHRTPVNKDNRVWGYVAEKDNAVFATVMKLSAARTATDKKTRYSYVESDYRSERPLVTSRELRRLDGQGHTTWAYVPQGVIVNGSIAIDAQRIVFVESRSPECVQHQTDRITLPTLMQKSHLICLSPKSGKTQWEIPLKWDDSQNMLFSQLADDKVILTTSASRDDKAHYMIRTLSAETGELIWEAKHAHVKNGLFHGEQVHHPVTLHRPNGKMVVVAEPFLYDLDTGERSVPENQADTWAIKRPGHSCGTLSGAGNCLFFRAGNPTVLNLKNSKFTALAPTRAGCWINMIPAGGRLLIPEGSASCVCHYSLQTSMAFTPISAESVDKEIPSLPDVFPDVIAPPAKPLYHWDFGKETAEKQTIQPSVGSVTLQALQPIRFTPNGLILDGTQWLSNHLEFPKLPAMPETVSLEAHVQVDSSPEWAGIVGALQDNGSYERGCMLGIHNEHYFFALASSRKAKLTYLTAPAKLEKGRMNHLAGSYDGNVMRLYVDGKQVAQSEEQKGALYTDEKSWLTVGAYKDNDELYRFQGIIKSVTIYDGVLKFSESELTP